MTNGNAAFFEVSGASGFEDPFGLWMVTPTAPSPADGDVSFAAPGSETSSPEEVIVWRINLPADAIDAENAFSKGEQRLVQAQSKLDEVPDKLDVLLASLSETRETEDGAVHFSAQGVEIAPDSPEADLLALVYEADAAANLPRTDEEVSFGLAESLGGKLTEVKAEFNSLLEQVNRELLNFAWVETAVKGQLIARSTVKWGGDAATFWVEGINNQQMALHQRSLKTAIETRNMRLRMVALVTSGAIRVSAMLATPGGQLMALPIAYKYIRAILAQVKN
jgi:hypothetical protein